MIKEDVIHTPALDEEVFNRNSVKKHSTRISADAARKEKEATRIKKISERMVHHSYIPCITRI